ncbi:hypothetical protein LOTGIDRAFT_102759, partial [Lottia gigantea]
AGICWYTVTKRGMCRNVNFINSTRDECCRTTLPTMSWSPHESPTRGTLFYWDILMRGAPRCSPCHTSCTNVHCGSNKRCRMRHGRPKCVCIPNCPRALRHSGLVCSSNGITFDDACELKRHNCRHGEHLTVAYTGPCRRSCRDVNCSRNLTCLEDQNGLPHCVPCVQNCSHVTRSPPELCGEDGVTYPSRCHLFQAICAKGKTIRLAYKSSCIENASCSTINCPENYTCLNDPRTGRPQCSNCNHLCNTSTRDVTVCGTDDITYSSYCVMQQTACASQTVIKTKYSGICNGMYDYIIL